MQDGVNFQKLEIAGNYPSIKGIEAFIQGYIEQLSEGYKPYTVFLYPQRQKFNNLSDYVRNIVSKNKFNGLLKDITVYRIGEEFAKRRRSLYDPDQIQDQVTTVVLLHEIKMVSSVNGYFGDAFVLTTCDIFTGHDRVAYVQSAVQVSRQAAQISELKHKQSMFNWIVKTVENVQNPLNGGLTEL